MKNLTKNIEDLLSCEHTYMGMLPAEIDNLFLEQRTKSKIMKNEKVNSNAAITAIAPKAFIDDANVILYEGNDYYIQLFHAVNEQVDFNEFNNYVNNIIEVSNKKGKLKAIHIIDAERKNW